MARIDRSFIGKGPIYIRERGSSGGMFPIGNCSVFSISFDEESKQQKDFTVEGGGNANSLTSVSAVTGQMTVHDYSSANLALFLRGIEGVQSAGSVVDEAHASSGVDGEFIPFDHLVDKSAPGVSVKKTDDSPLAETTDYVVENNGIIVVGSGGIDNTGVKISYTKDVAETMEALTAAGKEFELYFNGLNEAQGGSLFTARAHRVKFSPAQDLNFIGDEFGEMTADFEILSDGNIVGAGLSKFIKFQAKAPA